jgi:phenylalanyl-tRNA synthetase beta chain
LGSLLGVLKTNLNVGNTPCRIFEIADTFVPTGKKDALPVEEAKLAFLCDGDLTYLRGVIEGLVETVDRDAQILFIPASLVWAQAGAQIIVNGRAIGAAGIVSKMVKEKFDFKDLSPAAAEVDFESLLSLHKGAVKVKPIPRFPAIQRDLSIVVDEGIQWADILQAVKDKATAELEDIRFVGIYRGKGISSGRKSVTLSLRFRDEEGTLTHDTVDHFQADIVEGLSMSVGAELRTV